SSGETCNIPLNNLPGPGTHTVYFTSHDRAGNRGHRDALPLDPNHMGSVVVHIDHEDPLIGIPMAPAANDGANGWYSSRPWIGVNTFHLPVGGSGVIPGQGRSILKVDTGDGTGYNPYSGPFRLKQGTTTVCAKA